MQRPFAFLLSLIGAVFAASFSLAEARATSAQVVDQGVYCAVEAEAIETAEDTVAGVVSLVGFTPQFRWHGSVVPARIGIGFGVHLQVPPQFEGPVRVVTEHPPMGPAGVTRESWMTSLRSDDVNYLGFSFEYDYELVQGDWSFSATANGRQVFHADFTVVAPGLLPDMSCDGNIPIS